MVGQHRNQRHQLTGGLAARLVLALLCALCLSHAARAQVLMKELPEDLKGADLIERRGAQLPLDLEFIDSRGQRHTLADYFDGRRPVVLIFGYLDCPMLCDLVFSRAQRAFNQLKWTMGEEYRALTISFDHSNTTAQAAGKKAALMAGYGRNAPDDAWEFLVTDAATAKAITDAAGYQYKYIARRDEYSHPAVLVIVSPDGVISNYITASDIPERQLRLSLLDAADGKIGSVLDGFLHRCFIYDANEGSYVLEATFIMKVGGFLTVFVVGGGLTLLFLMERSRKRRLASATSRTERDGVGRAGALSHA